MKISNKKWLVFTDLDGTLLDAQTYSFLPAIEGLKFLQQKQIPLIFCTSKTYPEVRQLCKQTGQKGPFVVENGSAVFIPPNSFSFKDQKWRQIGDYHVFILGKPYEQIVSFLDTIRQRFQLKLIGFHEMELQEISHYTGLDEQNARFAKERLFSEPFVVKDEYFDFEALQNFAVKNGFRLLRGNRFYHLLGTSDKGKAVKYLTELYQREAQGEWKSLGIGDSPNDKDMLLAVDVPVIVRRPDGRYAAELDVPNLYCTEGAGPKGWNEAIFKLIS